MPGAPWPVSGVQRGACPGVCIAFFTQNCFPTVLAWIAVFLVHFDAHWLPHAAVAGSRPTPVLAHCQHKLVPLQGLEALPTCPMCIPSLYTTLTQHYSTM